MLSIVIPVYGVEKYLRRCLDSVLVAVNRLKTVTEVEVVCINDGSKDNCGLILDDYAKKDRRIRVHVQENMGLSATRRVGLGLIKGDYLCWVDSDDWVEPNHFVCLYDHAIKTGVDLVSCDVIKDFSTHSVVANQDCGSDQPRDLLSAILTRRVLAAVWNRIYKVSAIHAAGATCPDRDKIPIMEDTYFNSLFLLANPTISHIHQATYHYVIRPGSLSDASEAVKWWSDVICANTTIEGILRGRVDESIMQYRWGMFKDWMIWDESIPDEIYYKFHSEIYVLPKGLATIKERALFTLATLFRLRKLLCFIRRIKTQIKESL